MLVAPRYGNVEIPIYPPETDVADKGRIPEAIARSQGATVVRAAAVVLTKNAQKAVVTMSLAELLHKTDTELGEVAKLTGTQVIPHTWGLWKAPDSPRDHRAYGHYTAPPKTLDIPAGHILVAEVDIVRHCTEIEPFSELGKQISKGTSAYRQLPVMRLCDYYGAGNLSRGFTDHEPIEQAYVTDIEPRFQVIPQA